jgi:E3 ubiquitin-protein ligase UBR4
LKPPTIGKPSWMLEMETMQEETGLVCAVCQEGVSLQPKELLGLYTFVKKVSIAVEEGSVAGLDGTSLLKDLPASVPESLQGDQAVESWLAVGLGVADCLGSCSRSSSSKSDVYATSVTAGTAIHFSCHQRARQADRNHPKAPKSEWDGAALRNSRVACNAIFPLVSNRSSTISLMSVDSALSEYQSTISSLTNHSRSSMLWTVLHDVRLLMLRMAYCESLSLDCGGGSLASNSQLLIYQLHTATTFWKQAQVESPKDSQHASGLSAGFLAACAFAARASASEKSLRKGLMKSVAEAAPMAALTCIAFHNDEVSDCSESSPVKENCVAVSEGTAAANSLANRLNPRRLWVIGREYFLRGLVMSAGRRHALGVHGSGCIGSRGRNEAGAASFSRQRSSSFMEWDVSMNENEGLGQGDASSSMQTLLQYQQSLRPFLTLFVLLDQLSLFYGADLDDEQVRIVSDRLVASIEQCQRSHGLQELLHLARTPGAEYSGLAPTNTLNEVTDALLLDDFLCGMKTED